MAIFLNPHLFGLVSGFVVGVETGLLGLAHEVGAMEL